ncbi:MAG: tRNA dimethylallyltransferase [Candidatus Berkelbacteria bacterium]|nr:tRNA dimethylallyltransferase [Candidatus Berkelbacteria bacterium]
MIRALEGLLVLRNKKISRRENSPIPYPVLKIGIELPRNEVYKRIDKRTKEWMKEGLISEVNGLIRKGLSKKRINEFGLGYREVLKYLTGKIKNKDELTERINFSQHAYVRRQMTWFRHDKEINWCKNIEEAEAKIKKFLST